MKTSVMEVRDMLSVLSVLGVEKRIGDVPGVESVTVNYAAGNATVRYDETRLDIADIKSDVRQSGYADDVAVAVPAGTGHEGHSAPGAPPATPAPAGSKASPRASPPPGAAQPDKAAPPSTSKLSPGVEAASPAGDGLPDKAAPDKK